MSIIKKIKKHWRRFNMFLNQSSVYSYSQEGEDRILMRYFDNKATGFYVDVGAHHPEIYSNTFLFYQKGWSGINIDAMPGSMDVFKKKRKRDINIEAAISDKEDILNFYIFNEPALNTLSESIAKERHNPAKKHLLQKQIEIKTQTLTQVLEKNIPPNQPIDFMSIDIEGYDLQALQSLNLSKYRPELILTEVYAENIQDSPIYHYLINHKYSFYAKSVLTCFFKDNLQSS